MSTVNWSRIGSQEIKSHPNHGGFLVYRCGCGYQCASKSGNPQCVYCGAVIEVVA